MPHTVRPVSAPTNRLGLTALGVCGIGFVLACWSETMTAGWVLLAAAFVLGVAGTLRSGQAKGTSVAAVVGSLVGAAVSALIVIAGVAQFLVEIFWNLARYIFHG